MTNGNGSSYVSNATLRKQIVQKIAHSLDEKNRKELLEITKQLFSQYNNRMKSNHNIRENLRKFPNIKERLDLVKKARNTGVNSNIVKNFESGKITANVLKQKISNAEKNAENKNAFYLTGGYSDPSLNFEYKPKPEYVSAGGRTMFPSSLVN